MESMCMLKYTHKEFTWINKSKHNKTLEEGCERSSAHIKYTIQNLDKGILLKIIYYFWLLE